MATCRMFFGEPSLWTLLLGWAGTCFPIWATGKDVGFWTYKIESDERSQHPSIESIRDASEVGRQIEQLRLQTALNK